MPKWYAGLRLVAFILGATSPMSAAAAQTYMNGEDARNAGALCSGALNVHVIESFDHAPVIGASVLVNQVPAGITNADGRLKVQRVCQGRVLVDVIHGAYESAHRAIKFRDDAFAEIQLNFAVEDYAIEAKVAPAVNVQSTSTLSNEALERKRGQSLAETLSDVPGVTQLRSGSGLAKPIVRGQFGRRLPIIVDGVRHRSQDWGLDHAPEIDPFIADRITVVRGASAVRYGPDAIGGVVLVDPPEMRRSPGAEGQTHIVGFSNGLGGNLMSRVQAVSSALPAFTFQLQGSLRRMRAAETPDYPLDNTAQGGWNAGATVAYRASDATYKLSFSHLAEELGVCTCYRIESADDFFAQSNRQKPQGSERYVADFESRGPTKRSLTILPLRGGVGH